MTGNHGSNFNVSPATQEVPGIPSLQIAHQFWISASAGTLCILSCVVMKTQSANLSSLTTSSHAGRNRYMAVKYIYTNVLANMYSGKTRNKSYMRMPSHWECCGAFEAHVVGTAVVLQLPPPSKCKIYKCEKGSEGRIKGWTRWYMPHICQKGSLQTCEKYLFCYVCTKKIFVLFPQEGKKVC